MAKRKQKNPLQEIWNKLPAYARSRYALMIVVFLFVMIVVDRHDILTQLHLRRTVNQLEQERELYQAQIEEAKAERLDMEINRERFARETYFMQRDNEDVFIIVEDEEDPEN